MLVIRFQRTGRANDPAFRIVVTEKHSKPKSGEFEIVGSWHGRTDQLRLDHDRIKYWISKGAKPSPRVWNILVDQKVVAGKKVNVVRARPPQSVVLAAEAVETAAAAESASASLETGAAK